jgi:uncharacterized membrane protein
MTEHRLLPWHIILCFGWCIFYYILYLFNGSTLRILFGIPFLFFIPGFLFILSLFPSSRIDKKINLFERLVLSIVFSLAIVSLIGIGLNFTQLTLSLFWFATFLLGFNISFSIISLLRWYQQKPTERFIIILPKKIKKVRKPFESVLNIILFIVALSTFIVIIYVTISSFVSLSERGEFFTEFYILGEGKNANNYPKNITVGIPQSLTIGITNYEKEAMDYTIEVWLINQSTDSDQNQNNTHSIYYEMYFLKKIEVFLPVYTLEVENLSNPQWQYQYQFNITNLSGRYKMQFLLYDHSTDDYYKDKNYYYIADEKIGTAYRSLHLWMNIIDDSL